MSNQFFSLEKIPVTRLIQFLSQLQKSYWTLLQSMEYLECRKCPIQYAGNVHMGFKLRLKNHHKGVYKPDFVLALYHFVMKDHIFNRTTS